MRINQISSSQPTNMLWSQMIQEEGVYEVVGWSNRRFIVLKGGSHTVVLHLMDNMLEPIGPVHHWEKEGRQFRRLLEAVYMQVR